MVRICSIDADGGFNSSVSTNYQKSNAEVFRQTMLKVSNVQTWDCYWISYVGMTRWIEQTVGIIALIKAFLDCGTWMISRVISITTPSSTIHIPQLIKLLGENLDEPPVYK
ncbi:hypothetical protein SAY86_028910 [Trapa natans]|uniref:Uncharacterized protein n=1 Tax=Trapa natans TaxID=22666 RepID=A0AAN7M1E7_TRANT|nr:hypothetical protein SAY86_028910 [Trapa natans]